MTTMISDAAALLTQLRADGYDVRLVAPDRLQIWPGDRLTPDLKATIRAHKPGLLALLAADRYVTLRPGLIVPLVALNVALDFERRGFQQTVTEGGDYRVTPTEALLDEDRMSIHRLRRHLAALAAHEAPTCG